MREAIAVASPINDHILSRRKYTMTEKDKSVNENISVGISDLAPIKRLFNKALKEGEKEFVYRDQTIDVGYAKYLIEYMEKIFSEYR